MRKSVIAILVAVLAVCAGGCSDREAVERLNRAEHVMEEHPDSALLLIQGVDLSRLRTDKDRALYALLRTQALVKNDAVIASDSLIRTAVDYYTRHPRSTYLMKSNFYMGYVLITLQQHEEAIPYATAAYDMAGECNDPYWRAKAAEQIGGLFDTYYGSTVALPYTRESAIMYKKCGKYLNYLFTKVDEAREEGNIANHKKAIAILDTVISEAEKIENNKYILEYAYNSQLFYTTRDNDYERAKTVLDDMKSCGDSLMVSDHEQFSIIEILVYDGDTEKARALLDKYDPDKLEINDRVSYYDSYRRYAKKIGDLKLYSSFTDTLLNIQSDVFANISKRDVIVAQKEHYHNRANEATSLVSKTKSRLFFTLALSIILIILILIFYRWSVARKNRKINEGVERLLLITDKFKVNTQEYEKISHTLKDRNEEIEILSEGISKLYKDRWEILNELCYDYFEQGDSKQRQKQILGNIEKNIELLRSKKNIALLESSVDKYMGGIIADIRKECEFLSERDITFIILILSGLSPRTICLITDLKLQSFYTRRRRIIEAIEVSDCKSKQRFIEALKSVKDL